MTEIRNWYMKNAYVPQLGTIQFAKFAAHGYSFINEINHSPLFYKIDVTSPCAYFDRHEGVIALPGWYFIPEGVGKFSDGENINLDALALINGSTIHEALHSKLTTSDLESIVRSLKIEFRKRIKMQEIAMVVNTTEDIKIENTPLNAYQKSWLAAKNDLIFNDKVFDEAVKQFDVSNIQTVISLMMGFKRQSLHEKIGGLINPEIFKLLNEIKEHAYTMSVGHKFEIDKRIIELMLADAGLPDGKETGPGEESEDGEAKNTGGGAGSGGKDDEPKSEEDAESEIDRDRACNPKEDLAEGAGAKAPEVRASVDGDPEKMDAIDKSFAAAADGERCGGERRKMLSAKRVSLEVLQKNLKVVDVEKVAHGRNVLEHIELTSRFVNLLKQMRTVLPQRGRGKLSGGKLDVLRLHQIAIDQKLFSVKSIDAAGNNDRVEINILVDASGSMGRGDYHSTLFTHSIAVTHKIFMALINANIPTKVFAHTSYGPEDYPLLIKIADNFTKNFENKFGQALSVQLDENLDGVIINEVYRNHFSPDTRSQKILLVLSDGSPQSPSYTSEFGIPHTHKVIEDARKVGVKVYSISLTDEVVSYNDNLYGEEYNVNATENLDKSMVQLVTKLTRRDAR